MSQNDSWTDFRIEDEASPQQATVWTVHDFFDGCIIGVADFENQPHIYERVFDEQNDDWSENYYLTPISQDDFTLIMQDWQRWKEWRTAFDLGENLTKFSNEVDIEAIASKSNSYRNILCHGTFSGTSWAYAQDMIVEWRRLRP